MSAIIDKSSLKQRVFDNTFSVFGELKDALLEMASEIEQGELPDWGEAWEKVIKAIARCGSYDEEGALSSMDEVTRISVQRLGWLTLCMSEDISIERANFRMIYEAEAKRKKRDAQIPPRVAQLTAGMQLKRIDDMIRGEAEA